MTRLSKKDNHILLSQEWRLLFGTGTATQGGTTTEPISGSLPSDDGPTVPPTYRQDTFLVKSYFSESDMYYLVLVTNLKQCWCEKLTIEEIRQRSKKIRSFAYEEDSQLEALLLSLSAIFAADQSTPASSQRRIEEREGKLSLVVGFNFGLASVQWEFNLSPTIQEPGKETEEEIPWKSNHSTRPPPTDEELAEMGIFDRALLLPEFASMRPASASDLHLEYLENQDDDDSDEDALDGGDDNYRSYIERKYRKSLERKGVKSNTDKSNTVDGMSMMFDHLVLPLISLTNAYRKQVKGLEVVIKSKENEVVEALEMLEQCGVGYQNRRKATERYDKSRTEARLQGDIEQLVRPQMFGPKELFSDKLVPVLCSIVSKNAGSQDAPLSSFENSTTGFSQTQDLSSQTARGSAVKRPAPQNPDAATLTLQRDPATATIPAGTGSETTNAGGATTKSSKESEELERRRILQEQLEKEKAEKEKARKKKKLF
ncbi:hypothetical protein BGX34_004932 [Mortierella sp. NVP85]|nr:hypothetical protein BGX34_004932 [Mortierella sp. NVP85]